MKAQTSTFDESSISVSTRSTSAMVVFLYCVQVYWRHAAGDLDRYVVLIRYNHSVLQNKSISARHNDCVFSFLTPGRLYTVTVETWSGDYVSSVSTDGRTCELAEGPRTIATPVSMSSTPLCVSSVPAAVANLSLSNAGTGDLTVTWSPAPGDVEHYEVCNIQYRSYTQLNVLIHFLLHRG